MNDIQIFNYSGNEVRTIQKDGEPWFVLKDVCTVLGISHVKDTANRLENDEVGQTEVIDSIGRTQTATIINESGLYSVILRSDKPEAKPFRKWVTAEVLPSIRKHGAYMTENTLENMISSPEFGLSC
ncbi:MAG: Bro-N domain-containing protein [Anaeromassilibacillus sp.]